MKCNNCPRKCNIDRDKQIGYCGEGKNIRIAKIINNFMWEEPPITRNEGTCAIFFSGCSLKCSYCQNYKISRGGVGEEYSVEKFVELLKQIDQSENETIDLITPTHFAEEIYKAFQIYKPKKPIVWNSSGYENVEIIEKIAPYISIFLPDFKYGNNELALKLSNAKNYFEIAGEVICKMCELKPNKYQNKDLIEGVIIRHLILPGELENSIKILEFIKNNIKNPIVSVMSQFTPSGELAKGRRLKGLEYKIILKKVKELGLDKGFAQELESANENYIPNF